MSVFFPQLIYAVHFISFKTSLWVSYYGKHCGNEKHSLQRNGSKGQSIFIKTLPNPSILKTFLELLGTIFISDFETSKKIVPIIFQSYFIYDQKHVFPPLGHPLYLVSSQDLKYQRLSPNTKRWWPTTTQGSHKSR